MQKLYTGKREHNGVTVMVTDDRGTRPLDLRLDVARYSPTGFEFGYMGSGPAQLACALLMDALDGDAERVERVHILFKDVHISGIEGDEFSFTADQIRHYVNELEQYLVERAAL